MADQPRPPLWRVMHQYLVDSASTIEIVRTCQVLGMPLPDAQDWSEVIRALADWLVPEEAEPKGDISWARWMERELLRQLLLAEADRAKVGE